MQLRVLRLDERLLDHLGGLTRYGIAGQCQCQYRTAHRRRANGRAVLAGNMGLHSAAALAEQKRVRELLAQSGELLKQMQAG